MTVEDTSTNTVVRQTRLNGSAAWQTYEFEPLPCGINRVVVDGGAETQPAKDLFAILD